MPLLDHDLDVEARRRVRKLRASFERLERAGRDASVLAAQLARLVAQRAERRIG